MVFLMKKVDTRQKKTRQKMTLEFSVKSEVLPHLFDPFSVFFLGL